MFNGINGTWIHLHKHQLCEGSVLQILQHRNRALTSLLRWGCSIWCVTNVETPAIQIKNTRYVERWEESFDCCHWKKKTNWIWLLSLIKRDEANKIFTWFDCYDVYKCREPNNLVRCRQWTSQGFAWLIHCLQITKHNHRVKWTTICSISSWQRLDAL